MNYKKLSVSVVLGLAISNSIFANENPKEIKDFEIINSIEYIEEQEVCLGFNTEDYLPEGFDPNTFYFDVNSVDFLEDTLDEEDFSMFLPDGFNAYAYPSDVQSINYIDANDTIKVDLDTKDFLPEDFNPFLTK